MDRRSRGNLNSLRATDMERDTQSETGVRVHVLTEKASTLYESEVHKYTLKLSNIHHELEQELLVYQRSDELNKDQLTFMRHRLIALYEKYDKLSTEFTGFLVRKNSKESVGELHSQQIIQGSVKGKCEFVLTQLKKDIEHCKSTSAHSQTHSKTSSRTTSMVLKQKAKLQAAHVKLNYVTEEAELMKKKAEIEASMTLLSAKKEVDVTNAELQAIYDEISEIDEVKSRSSIEQSKHERVEHFVKEQDMIRVAQHEPSVQGGQGEGHIYDRQGHQDHPSHQPDLELHSVKPGHPTMNAHSPLWNGQIHIGHRSRDCPSIHQGQGHLDSEGHPTCQGQTLHSTLNVHNPLWNGQMHLGHRSPDCLSQGQGHQDSEGYLTCQGQIPHPNEKQNHRNHSIQIQETPASCPSPSFEGFSQFLLKKDLLRSRLSKFDDKPESFLSWKATFHSVVGDMKVNAAEEMDLLIKWLGPESSRHATSMRNANTANYSKGLQLTWNRLEERYGSAETIDDSLKRKLQNFPKVTFKEKRKLYELGDILSEILSVKTDPKYERLLSYYDTSVGVNPIVVKLPQHVQNKWRERATTYKRSHNVPYPPFSFFVEFVNNLAVMINDPGFSFDTEISAITHSRPVSRTKISTAKTAVVSQDEGQLTRCPIHNASHSLNDCRQFRQKPLHDRRQMLSEHGLCFKCLGSKQHISRNCPKEVKCQTCSSTRHATGMHPTDTQSNMSTPIRNHGGERTAHQDVSSTKTFDISSTSTSSPASSNVISKCTEICRNGFKGRSCAKIVYVNVCHSEYPDRYVRTYAILDEQSNKSLAKEELFNAFGINSQSEDYTMSSCAGRVIMSGRRSKGFIVESLDGTTQLNLPTVIECEEIPDNRDEIPTPEVAMYHPHLEPIAHQLSPLDPQSDILLLIGRDMLEAHHVIEQRLGPPSKPYAQRLRLGWVIVGETCLGGAHAPDVVSTMKTYLTTEGRPSVFKPCDNKIHVHESPNQTSTLDTGDQLGSTVFVRTDGDDRPGMSIEDKSFLSLMNDQCYQGQDGHWIAPLPFRTSRSKLPNNRSQALYRAKNLDSSLKRDAVKKEHFLSFMEELLDSGHAELAPPLVPGEECWYLPLFGVYHPRKRDQIRCVFDSSAKFNGTSLNDVLLTGPDLTNSLVGVLMRFRKEAIAVTADIKKMFYCFMVRPEDRNYLRFLWHWDNDINKELVDFRMKVHVFGNSPSPAVATYGLRKTAEAGERLYGSDVKEFVNRNFYVDDALSSHPTSDEAVGLLKRTQAALKDNGNLRLHKVASNSEEVLSAFPVEDLAKNLMDLDFQKDALPLQRSLGLAWDIRDDVFKFLTSVDGKPFTRRGVLSVVNSIFDPLGFVAPVTIKGKLLLRQFMSNGLDWDDTFHAGDYEEWRKWKESLMFLENLRIPRSYVNISPSRASRRELHVFSDASEKAIAAVSYLRVIDTDGSSHVGYLFGKTKVAPSHGHTIPRLELCAAVMAVYMTEFIMEHLDLGIDAVKYYTDSRVVLGYIQNEKRRFYVYVGNRVDIIRKSSQPSQWNYVPTNINPADLGTRSIPACEMQESVWIHGPVSFLDKEEKSAVSEDHNLVSPEEDKEIRPTDCVNTMKANVGSSETNDASPAIGTHRYERFSTWKGLVRAISFLRRKATRRKVTSNSVDFWAESERFIIKSVQNEIYSSEILCLRNRNPMLKTSHIISLNPYLDEKGILRVGGRLRKMSADMNDKHPILLPGSHHVSTLLVRYHHEKVKHMGRHFTDGAVRSAGLWITGVKRLINSLLHKCVLCRKRRGNVQLQKMADLPEDRLEVAPPFTNVGLDVFGPWLIVARKTRGGQANSKRWAVIFTCLVTRAIHIEVIDEMSSSAFINASRRFIAIRGNVKIFRSDRGTNFVGATEDLRIDAINVEDGPMRDFLFNTGTTWAFNSPHSSHMGGAWERMIGVSRKILDSMLSDLPCKNLTHDVLVTLMAEVSAIVNARPLVPVSTDPESPCVLSPATLLTMKTDHSVKSFAMKDFSIKDLYKHQWRQVQYLSNRFWSQWRKEYLHTLQGRRKWQSEAPNLKKGDVVLLKDNTVHRNDWPLGTVQNPLPSDDGLVRKVEICIVRDGKSHVYTRPVTELVSLLSV